MNDREEKILRQAKEKVKARNKSRQERGARRFPLQTLTVPESRPCGACQACCTAVGVHELDKAPWTPCNHQCKEGCGIYEERPPSCRNYYCLWQAGFFKGGEELRPDNLGVIFDYRATLEGVPERTLSVWEIREGGIEEPTASEILSQLAESFVLAIRRFNGRGLRLIGPSHLIREIKRVTQNE